MSVGKLPITLDPGSKCQTMLNQSIMLALRVPKTSPLLLMPYPPAHDPGADAVVWKSPSRQRHAMTGPER